MKVDARITHPDPGMTSAEYARLVARGDRQLVTKADGAAFDLRMALMAGRIHAAAHRPFVPGCLICDDRREEWAAAGLPE